MYFMKLWSLQSDTLTPIKQIKLDNEDRLENWIEKDPSILGLDFLMIIGRQVQTEFGGLIDLLGINEEGDLTIIELKRDRTPREVVAQALDYASWVNELSYDQVKQIAEKYLERNFEQAFEDQFGISVPDSINSAHNIVIVASELDESTKRIVNYLSAYNLNINCVFFQVFSDGKREYIGQLNNSNFVYNRNTSKRKAPIGYYHFNIKESYRSWNDCTRYGFLSAGGDKGTRTSIQRLKKGDKVFAYMGKVGFLGFGTVEEEACMVKDFKLDNGEYLLEQNLEQPSLAHDLNDPEKCEWAVKVKWVKTLDKDNAVYIKDLKASPNVVCRLDFNAYQHLKAIFEQD